jgi:hypothetical protein
MLNEKDVITIIHNDIDGMTDQEKLAKIDFLCRCEIEEKSIKATGRLNSLKGLQSYIKAVQKNSYSHCRPLLQGYWLDPIGHQIVADGYTAVRLYEPIVHPSLNKTDGIDGISDIIDQAQRDTRGNYPKYYERLEYKDIESKHRIHKATNRKKWHVNSPNKCTIEHSQIKGYQWDIELLLRCFKVLADESIEFYYSTTGSPSYFSSIHGDGVILPIRVDNE